MAIPGVHVEPTQGGFTIEEAARRLGHARWVEIQLFEVLGAWVGDTLDVDIKLRFASASRHCGWHAELLEERLPTVRELSPQRQTVPGSPAFVQLFDDIATTSSTAGRMSALHRVILPHLIAAYGWHRDRCVPVCDQSVERTLGFLLRDHMDEWRFGEMWLQQHPPLVPVPRDRWESLLVAAGGISGPTTFVEPRDITPGSSPDGPDVEQPG